MSYLVSDLFINPLLRQARRFSSSNLTSDHVDSLTAVVEAPENRHETAIAEIAEHADGMARLETGEHAELENIYGATLVPLSIQEDGVLEEELRALESGRPPSAPAILGHSQAITLRVASLRSEPGRFDDDVTHNPSFGTPTPFRTDSPSSGSFSSTSQVIVDARMSPAEGPSSHESRASNRRRNSSLPADDGMGDLRQQIILIQSKDIPAEEKARMMHQLLTQGYSQAQVLHTKLQPKTHSPGSMVSQEHHKTTGPLGSFNFWQVNGSSEASPSNQHHTFHLSPDDLRPTFAPSEESLEPDDTCEDGESHSKQIQCLGCKHYKRNVKLQCSTCDRWYTCRLCHDDAEDHILIRKATKNMLCMLCGYAQRAGEFCAGCNERTAWYYCDVCKLWDNDAQKNIYHCNDCGICRKGRGLGKDFFHCKTCGVCMSMSVEHSHKCIERVSDCDCPICGEYMFTSPQTVVFMPCGHSIHQKCYYEHMKSSYKCPICSKSTVNMETQFRNLDRAIENQPMPPQFQDTKAMVSCNDCYAKSAVKYHWLGLKCAICDSYNTAQLSILSDPAVEVPVIESGGNDHATVPDQAAAEGFPSMRSISGLVRQRRHSSHMRPTEASLTASNGFSPYPIPQRMGRSVSPVRGVGFFNNPIETAETEESGDEEDLDFWGRDEPRSVTSAENVGDGMDENDDEYEEDSDSAMGDCDDEEGDEEDQFELLGHR